MGIWAQHRQSANRPERQAAFGFDLPWTCAMLAAMPAPRSPLVWTPQQWRRRLTLLPAATRAVGELALARLRHLFLSSAKIQTLNRRANEASANGHVSGDEMVELVAFVIPRVASRLPWRSDCLIQAMAAQRWLHARGIASSITIGVQLPGKGEFAAHAWLKHGDRIVTGGDITDFSPIFTDRTGQD